jgi:hypothetical protein
MAGLEIILRIVGFFAGASIVFSILFSATQTFVLPRSTQDPLSRIVFIAIRTLFNLRMARANSYLERDRILAFYAPVALLMLVPVWYFLVVIGYMLIFRSIGTASWFEAFRDSGSSLFTLGFATINGWARTATAFSEAAIGLLLMGLLIAYLPTMYSAFARREAAVTLLEVRAGNPPTPVEMILRYYRIGGLDQLTSVWRNWEDWFADISESHTSLPALVFFRSPQGDRSWITAAGAVLDAAALMQSTVNFSEDPQAALCIRSGYLALRRIADFFDIAYDANPSRGDPISIPRSEYDSVVAELAENGVPVKADQETAWLDFCGWRVNYDKVLLTLAGLTMAPWSPWTGSRQKAYRVPLWVTRPKN